MMNRQTIEEAQKLAQELDDACTQALIQLDMEIRDWNERYPGEKTEGPDDYSHGSMYTGALRRKSMDVTRKLAELRKHS